MKTKSTCNFFLQGRQSAYISSCWRVAFSVFAFQHAGEVSGSMHTHAYSHWKHCCRHRDRFLCPSKLCM